MKRSRFPLFDSSRRDAGFSLQELAVVLVVAGIILAGAIAIALPILQTARNIETNQKLENIAKAINYYARQNDRLPCPAAPNAAAVNPPFGFEAGSGAAGDVIPDDCGAAAAGWEGIVPFKTLNIPSDWVRDAWGNFITYAISPGFSQNALNAALPVHSRCRTADWFTASIIYEVDAKDPGGGGPATDILTPRNDRKARFCCSGADRASDLIILDANGQSQMAFPRQPLAGSYAAANVTFPNPMQPNVQVPANDRVSAPVYVLVSPGGNGFGAYLTQPAGARAGTVGATPAEIENADGDRTFYEIPRIDGKPLAERNFDDVVLWRTQDAIFAEAAESCSLP